MSNQADAQAQMMIQNMPEKTGKSILEWYKILADSKLEKHGEMLNLLKSKYGVKHGFVNTIVMLYREQAAGGPRSNKDLVTAQYQGAKAGLCPIYDIVLEVVRSFGSDVEVAPKKTTVSLRRRVQFAMIQASTKDRVDLGLNLRGIESADRLGGGNIFSGMCTRLVRLLGSSEVDEQVRQWLRLAYEAAQ